MGHTSMSTLAVLALLILTRVAEAKPVLLNVVRVENEHYGTELAEQAVNRAVRSIRKEVGVKVIIKSWVEMGEYCDSRGDGLTTQERLDRLFCYRSLGVFDIADPILFLVPPITNASGWFLAGYASSQCYKRDRRPTAYAAVEESNDKGEDRRRHSIVVIKHELAHLLGATHDNNGRNIMHPDPLPMVGGEENRALKFSKRTIEEIKGCIQK